MCNKHDLTIYTSTSTYKVSTSSTWSIEKKKKKNIYTIYIYIS
jgi:hypothetical protein